MSESTPLPFGSQQAHRPSISEQHRWRAGHRDSGLQVVLESRVESYGSGERETNYLKTWLNIGSLRTNPIVSYSSRHPNRCDLDDRCWGDRSWSGSGFWVGS